MEKASNFDKDCADVLAASDRSSYFEQEKLIAPDEEYERYLQYVRSADFLINMHFLSLVYENAFYLTSASLNLFC